MAGDKKFYWIKLKDTFMTSDTVDFLMGQKNGANYVVLYQMLCLKTVNTNGELARKIGEIIIPYDAEKIQRDCKYFDIDTIRVALELYKQLGLIYKQEDSILKIANFENMVGSETAWAEKKRLYREKSNRKLESGQSTDNVLDNFRQEKEKEIRDKRIDIRDIDNRKYKESISKDIPKKASKSTFDDIISSYTSNSELHNSIIEFIKMRKLIKKPLTDKALNLLFSSLDKLSKSDTDKKAILEQSILNCWQGVFPLKTDKPKTNERYSKEQLSEVLVDMETWEL